MKDISRETIIKAANGDLDAFEEIYKATSSFVYNVTLKITGNREDAEEATQDVFMRAYRSLAAFRFRSSLKTWIYRIAVNMAINKYNSRKKVSEMTVEYNDELENPHTGRDTMKEIYAEDHRKMIDRALGVLSPGQRACVVLRSMEGMTYEEIAKTLGVNLNTVRTRLKRAREKMVQTFGKRREA